MKTVGVINMGEVGHFPLTETVLTVGALRRYSNSRCLL